jgi:hypothetical protein
MFKIYDVVRIKGLRSPEDEWNGQLALVISEPYRHPIHELLVVKIKIYDTLWAIEVTNVEKVNDAERLHYFRSYEGNQVCTWEMCNWKPPKKDFHI